MKFYIASSLGNYETAEKIANYLVSRGWEQTYDWTKHGAVTDPDSLKNVSDLELRGVTGCDVFFLLLPAKRGSHTEFGAALAFGKPVIILSPEQDLFFEGGLTCSFYHHPGIKNKIIERDWFALACMAYREGRKRNWKKRSKNSECPDCRGLRGYNSYTSDGKTTRVECVTCQGKGTLKEKDFALHISEKDKIHDPCF